MPVVGSGYKHGIKAVGLQHLTNIAVSLWPVAGKLFDGFYTLLNSSTIHIANIGNDTAVFFSLANPLAKASP